MKVHEDFSSKKLTLIFDEGRRLVLNKAESKEFEKWYLEKEKERNS